jgi:hypothetical protein
MMGDKWSQRMCRRWSSRSCHVVAQCGGRRALCHDSVAVPPAAQGQNSLSVRCPHSRAFIRAATEDPYLTVPSPTFLLQQLYEIHEGTLHSTTGAEHLRSFAGQRLHST